MGNKTAKKPAKAAKAPAHPAAKKAAAKAPQKTLAKGIAAKSAGGKVDAAQEAPTQDQMDEMEEQADAAAARTSSPAGGPPTGEVSASFKNFRHHPDMENFYRFIYDNDLRYEALAIIDIFLKEKQARRAAKASGSAAH